MTTEDLNSKIDNFIKLHEKAKGYGYQRNRYADHHDAWRLRIEDTDELLGYIKELRAAIDDRDICDCCGSKFSAVYWADDEQWQKVMGHPFAGCFCPLCFEGYVRAAGLEPRYEIAPGEFDERETSHQAVIANLKKALALRNKAYADLVDVNAELLKARKPSGPTREEIEKEIRSLVEMNWDSDQERDWFTRSSMSRLFPQEQEGEG